MAIVQFNDDFLRQLKFCLEIKNLEIVVRQDWGSQSNHFRESIHGDLKKQMAKAYPFSDSSISHSHNLGGYVFSIFDAEDVYQIGFDIEESARAKAETVRRIAFDADELNRSPTPASLWVAKEAAFKALKGPKQPPVVSEIEIGEWTVADSQFETTLVKNAKKFGFNFLKGCAFKREINSISYHFCVFIAKP